MFNETWEDKMKKFDSITKGCQAVKNGEVKTKGKASIEGYKDGKPLYFCYGYNDKTTDELIETCKNCKENIIYAE